MAQEIEQNEYLEYFPDRDLVEVFYKKRLLRFIRIFDRDDLRNTYWEVTYPNALHPVRFSSLTSAIRESLRKVDRDSIQNKEKEDQKEKS